MKKINLGKSRYGDIRELHEIEVGKYSTEGFKKMAYIGIQGTKDGNGFLSLDPDGGPFIAVGGLLPTAETITSIKFEDGRYLIYTNKYVENDSIDKPQSGDSNK